MITPVQRGLADSASSSPERFLEEHTLQNCIGGLFWHVCLLLATSSVLAATVSDSFQVSAVIENGCTFGSKTDADDFHFGIIDFGEHSAINGNVDVASSNGAGSLSVTCTPGSTVAIALDYGINGGNSSARYLINGAGNRTLAYQLYQDAGYSRMWGAGAAAVSVTSFPASTETFTVYARLFPVSQPPPADTYTDTITVTLTY